MNIDESLWKINYIDEKKRHQVLEEAIDMLMECDDKSILCTYIDAIAFYYDKLSVKYQTAILELYSVLETCNMCSNCCKNSEYFKNAYRKLLISQKHSNSCLNYKSSNIIKKQNLSQSAKVVAIVPDFLSAVSFLQPPIDFLIPRAISKKENIDFNIIDNRLYHYSFEELNKTVELADCIVFSTSPYDHIQNYFLDIRLKLTFELIKKIKCKNEKKTVIVCGAHGSVRPDIVYKETGADLILRGEYDYCLIDIIKRIINNEEFDNRFIYKKEDYLLNKSFSSFEHNIDLYEKHRDVLPSYDNVDFNDYFGNRHTNNHMVTYSNHATILASRGCYNNCSFCFNFWGNNVRFREPQSVVDEMEMLQKKHSVSEIFFIDATFTQNRKWVIDICLEIIKRELKIFWSAETRCDRLDPELLRIMAKANCKSIWLGVESYCDCILKENRKFSSNRIAIDAINMCKKENITPKQFILIGLPGETTDSLNSTICYLKDIKACYTNSVMVATPRFGTLYYDLAKKQYPYLGCDFYSLTGVKGIVENHMTPQQLREAVVKFRNIKF